MLLDKCYFQIKLRSYCTFCGNKRSGRVLLSGVQSVVYSRFLLWAAQIKLSCTVFKKKKKINGFDIKFV